MASTLPSREFEGVKISNICLANPHVRMLMGDPRFHLRIKYDGKIPASAKTMKKSLEGDRISWDESFSFADDATGSVTFEVVKTHGLIRRKLGLCREKVINLLQVQDDSGSCKLDLGDKSGQLHLTFDIERLSSILQNNVEEALEASPQISTTEAPAKAAGLIISAHDTFVEQEVTWSSFLTQFSIFMKAMDDVAKVHPYANLAWSILSIIPKTVLSYKTRNDSVRQLCEKLKEIYDFITDAERLSRLSETQDNVLSVLVQQTIECGYFIREYSTENTVNKLWKGTSVDDKVKAFNDKFDHLKSVMTDSITLETGIVTLRVSEAVSEIRNLHLLDDMPYARDAGFLSNKKCLPGTRQKLIDEILEWVNGDTSERILVLTGQAGTGKSAVAHTIAELFKSQNRLGSLFCFNRSYKDRRNFLFSTISRDVADGDVSWRESLAGIINTAAIRRSSDSDTQFNELIIKPSKAAGVIGPVIIVIDALDESGERHERRTLLDLLFNQTSMLPSNYRLILTTRPEPDITPCCEHPSVLCKQMGDIADSETFLDIQSYVSFRLDPISSKLDKIEKKWREILAKHAEGLFQWADTACRFIDPTIHHPLLLKKHWDACTSNSATSLYELYHSILSSQQETKDPEFINDFKLIICAVMAAREPLSISALENIFEGTIQNIKELFDPFGSLFLGVYDPSSPIRPLHTSLFDFFNSQDQGTAEKNKYYVDTSSHSNFASGCLKLMNRMLCFNICKLETSHLWNQHVPEFYQRVKKAIPAELSYACRFWGSHFRQSHDWKGLLTEVRKLMHDNLLYFFEALSLLGEVEQGLVSLKIVESLCKHADSELADEAADAWQFGFKFVDMITQSTPHLYISALPFTPSNSFISKRYLPLYPQLVKIEVGESLDSAQVAKSGLMKRNEVSDPTRLMFSPGAQYLVSGFRNGSFWVWDYETGEMFYQSRHRAGKDWIISNIVFSPDGQLVYCCYKDGIIHIWNAKTNEVIEESYEDILKAEGVGCRISSDGSLIVFSNKCTILLYDRRSHQRLREFDTIQHSDPLFSPKGDLLAFSRREGEICLWNTRMQTLVHSWTQDGCWIGALSDKSIAIRGHSGIEVWDIRTLTMVTQFETGYRFLRFSNDPHLHSASDENFSIREISAEEVIVGFTLEGHSGPVVASHDLKYIAFCGRDNTIYVQRGVPIQPKASNNANTPYVLHFSLRSRYLIQLLSTFWANETVRISDITTMNNVVLDVSAKSTYRKDWFPVAVSPHEDNIYVTYVTTRGLCLWNEIEGEFVLDKSSRSVISLGFSTAGDRLISGDSDGVVQIWNIHTRSLMGEPHRLPKRLHALEFSASGDSFLLAYTSSDEPTFVEVRECHSGRILKGPFKSPQSAQPYQVAFSASEARIICMSYSGCDILSMSMGTSEVFHPRPKTEYSQQISPNKKYLAWLSDLQRLNLWDIDRGKALEGLLLDFFIAQFGFSNDSTQLIMSCAKSATEYQVDFWDISTRKITRSISFPTLRSRQFGPQFPVLASNGIHLALALMDSVSMSLDLEVAEIMSSLYKNHQSRSQFGVLPVEWPETTLSAQTLNKSTSNNNKEILEYALMAWHKALFSPATRVDGNGWMLGPFGELLLWIPKEQRKLLWHPCVTHMVTNHLTKFNFNNFVHGSRWAECGGAVYK